MSTAQNSQDGGEVNTYTCDSVIIVSVYFCTKLANSICVSLPSIPGGRITRPGIF